MTKPEHTAAAAAAAPAHEVHLDDGRFSSAQCSCGGRTAGRRSRSIVRAEARDHALLYADGRELAPELSLESDAIERRASAEA